MNPLENYSSKKCCHIGGHVIFSSMLEVLHPSSLGRSVNPIQWRRKLSPIILLFFPWILGPQWLSHFIFQIGKVTLKRKWDNLYCTFVSSPITIHPCLTLHTGRYIGDNLRMTLLPFQLPPSLGTYWMAFTWRKICTWCACTSLMRDSSSQIM